MDAFFSEHFEGFLKAAGPERRIQLIDDNPRPCLSKQMRLSSPNVLKACRWSSVSLTSMASSNSASASSSDLQDAGSQPLKAPQRASTTVEGDSSSSLNSSLFLSPPAPPRPPLPPPSDTKEDINFAPPGMSRSTSNSPPLQPTRRRSFLPDDLRSEPYNFRRQTSGSGNENTLSNSDQGPEEPQDDDGDDDDFGFFG